MLDAPNRLARRWLRPLALLAGLGAWLPAALGAPMSALGYEPKYPPGFGHFDYVDERARVGGVLRVSGVGSFDSFNPFLLKSIPPAHLGSLVFETLMRQSLDEPFSAYSLLASEIREADDGLSVEFDIDERARFSHGEPVLAADVVFSFETLTGLKAHPKYRSYFRDVASAEAIGERSVRFSFHRRNAELALILATGLPIFSPDWPGESEFDETARVMPIASGPYRVGDYALGSFIEYQRRSDYWGWHKAVRRHSFSFEQVRVEYYFDLNIALEAFKAGEFDIHHEYNSKQWARAYSGRAFDSGEILREGIRHSANAGIQGFFFNLRRDKFADLRVRRAITLAYDFHWSNKSLFHAQYVRNHSYFSNSELAAAGAPDAAELALLEPWRDDLPASVFGEIERLRGYHSPQRLRAALIEARALLIEAGWRIVDGRLRNAEGALMDIDFLLAQTGFERILMPFAHNLRKLGIRLNIRRVDRALYLRRLRDFDYDMIVGGYSASESPGNELYERFGSGAVDVPGQWNFCGVSHPAVDALLDGVVQSRNRRELITAARALDRVLWSLQLMVPNWYTDRHRLAWRAGLARPAVLPKFYDPIDWAIEAWWWQ